MIQDLVESLSIWKSLMEVDIDVICMFFIETEMNFYRVYDSILQSEAYCMRYKLFDDIHRVIHDL